LHVHPAGGGVLPLRPAVRRRRDDGRSGQGMTPHRPAPPQLLTRRALADQVYDRLIADLVDGRIEPDSAISIDGLARSLGVSQTPIREALGRLEATGLVTRLPFKGYRAAPPLSLEDLRQLSEARRVIEPANARLAA